jgi:hypothetical protein
LTKSSEKLKKYLPLIIIALVCIVACWQVSFFTQTLKYDILDGYLPGHYFMSECLRNNVFPLWNPYQQLGFPIHADLTNTNYVIDMLISRLFPYTNITFHILFIIYLIIAGLGTYKLSEKLGISEKMSLMTGISYMLSGFFIGNAQHIQFIAGAAWLPWILYAFLKLVIEIRTKSMLMFVLFTSLFISGGYPSLAILLVYLLATVFIVIISKYLMERKYRKAVLLSTQCLIAAMLLFILSSGIILSIIQSTPYVGRFTGLSYETAINNSFSPASLISLISPLTPAEYPEFFHTDVSMNNIYIGVFLFMFFVYALFRPFNYKSLYFLIAGLIILLISFGDGFFLHRILYDYLPLFDKFRHPSALRVFTILFFLLFTGIQVTRHNPVSINHIAAFRRIYLSFLIIVFLTCLISLGLIIERIIGPAYFNANWNSMLKDYGLAGPLFLQTALFLAINLPFVYFIMVRKNLNLFSPLAFATVIIEIVVFTQINQPYTVISKYNPFEIRRFLRERPAGFPLPDQRLISENTDQSVSFFPLTYNTNTYSKTVSSDFRYPFYLNSLYELDRDSLLIKNVIQNRMLYFGDTILSLSSNYKGPVLSKKKLVIIEDSLFKKVFNRITPQSFPTDTIVCSAFSPSHFSFKTFSPENQVAVLLQNDYPGWKVYIDRVETPHYTVNRTLIGIIVPAGKHEIVFKYSNPKYQWATFISFGLFFALVVTFFVLQGVEKKKAGHRSVYSYIVVILVFILVLLALKPKESFARILKENNREISEHLQKLITDEEKTFLLFNTESSEPFIEENSRKHFAFMRFRKSTDAMTLWNMLDTTEYNTFIYVWANVIKPAEVRDIIRMYFPRLTEQFKGEKYTIQVYTKDTIGPVQGKSFCNNYEVGHSDYWSNEGVVYDSNRAYSGEFSERLNSEREYSATFRYKLDQIPQEGIGLFASVRFRAENIRDCYLVISINRHEEAQYYHALDLRQYCSNQEDWNIGFASFRWLRSSLKRGDEIVVYCWNKGKNEAILLDDFTIRIY